jgi:hypothetical protein
MMSKNKIAEVIENLWMKSVTASMGRITHEGPHLIFSHSGVKG